MAPQLVRLAGMHEGRVFRVMAGGLQTDVPAWPARSAHAPGRAGTESADARPRPGMATKARNHHLRRGMGMRAPREGMAGASDLGGTSAIVMPADIT